MRSDHFWCHRERERWRCRSVREMRLHRNNVRSWGVSFCKYLSICTRSRWGVFTSMCNRFVDLVLCGTAVSLSNSLLRWGDGLLEEDYCG